MSCVINVVFFNVMLLYCMQFNVILTVKICILLRCLDSKDVASDDRTKMGSFTKQFYIGK